MALKMLVVCFILTAFYPFLSHSLAYLPILQQKFGPLYDAIDFLISDELVNAATVWHETSQQLNHSISLIFLALDELAHFDPAEHLKTLDEITKDPDFYHCYKSYERQIAHFDREFIGKYEVCRQTLNVAASHIREETFEELNFLRNAALVIAQVASTCKVKDLKYAHKNHAGILLCLIARLGEIDQRLLEAGQLILDIVAEMAVGTNIDPDDSCHTYNELKMEFAEIFDSIQNCINKN